MLKQYLNNTSPKTLAKLLGISIGHIRHIASGNRQASIKLALTIEKATDGSVTRFDLRPELFQPNEKCGIKLINQENIQTSTISNGGLKNKTL